MLQNVCRLASQWWGQLTVTLSEHQLIRVAVVSTHKCSTCARRSHDLVVFTVLVFLYRLSLHGMGQILARCAGVMTNCCVDLEEIGAMRRYSVDDQFVTSLLHGVRLCL